MIIHLFAYIHSDCEFHNFKNRAPRMLPFHVPIEVVVLSSFVALFYLNCTSFCQLPHNIIRRQTELVHLIRMIYFELKTNINYLSRLSEFELIFFTILFETEWIRTLILLLHCCIYPWGMSTYVLFRCQRKMPNWCLNSKIESIINISISSRAAIFLFKI